MKFKTILLLSLTLLLVISTSAAALAAPPPLPSSLYGTVQLGGAVVPDGTFISTWINGTKVAETTSLSVNGDSVYIVDVPGDDPDTPTIEGGQEGDTIVFQVAGIEADQTALWTGGEVTERNLTATPKPIAGFTTSKAMNVARMSDGASIADYSSFWSNSWPPENAIDNSFNTYWFTGRDQITDQWIKVDLTGDEPRVVDRVVIGGYTGMEGLKDFEIRVSNHGIDDADFTTVYSGTVPWIDAPHEFSFPPVKARYVQLFILNNYGHPGSIAVRHFEVWTRAREGGIVSLLEGPPSSIVGVSSENSANYTADKAIDASSSSMWRSANGMNTDQWIKVQLGGGLTYTIDRVRLQSSSTSLAVLRKRSAISISVSLPHLRRILPSPRCSAVPQRKTPIYRNFRLAHQSRQSTSSSLFTTITAAAVVCASTTFMY
jgi:hypothetical protein